MIGSFVGFVVALALQCRFQRLRVEGCLSVV